LGYSKQTG